VAIFGVHYVGVLEMKVGDMHVFSSMYFLPWKHMLMRSLPATSNHTGRKETWRQKDLAFPYTYSPSCDW